MKLYVNGKRGRIFLNIHADNRRHLAALVGAPNFLFWLFKQPLTLFIKSAFEGTGIYILPSCLLLIVMIVHFYHNQSQLGSLENKDLASLTDYILFTGTHIVIICTLVTLLREIFYLIWFAEASCKNFNKIDIFSFIASVSSLATYSYAKIKPIWQAVISADRQQVESEQNQENV